MKKRILSAIIMSALILSMTACGASTDSADTANNADTTTASAAEEKTTAADEEKTEAATSAPEETEETTTTTEAPVELSDIKQYDLFMNSCLSFSADGKNYVLNIADKKLYEYDTEGLDDFYAISGNIALFGDPTTYDNAYSDNAGVYNLETKEVMASADTNGIMPYTWWEGMTSCVPVVSVEKGFDGDVYSVGVISDNGEWVLPLSTDYAICNKEYASNAMQYNEDNDYMTMMDSYDYDSKFYDFKNDKFLKLNGIIENITAGLDGYNSNNSYTIVNAYQNNNFLIHAYVGARYPDEITYFAKYNADTEELIHYKTDLKDVKRSDWAYYLDDVTIYRHNINQDDLLCLDKALNKLDYDFSEYEIDSFYTMNGNAAVFNALNPENEHYVIILKNDGIRAVDPIMGYSSADNSACIIGDYVVLNRVKDSDENTNDYIINCKTGETKTFTADTYDIMDWDKETGMLLVKADGAIYLAHVSDPDTLIHPFEMAE